MCSVNHDLKAIFIQIPKTGGSYVHNVLRDCYGFETFRFTRHDHKEYNGPFALKDDEKGCASIYGFVNTRTTGILHYFETSSEVYERAKITPEQWQTYTKFSFIRNPYDKIVSAWKFIKKVKHIPHTFEEFLAYTEDCDNSIYSHSFIPQYTHLLNKHNECKISLLGRFENLNEDLIYILKQIGVTKIKHQKYVTENIKMNVSNKTNYVSFYNEQTLQMVNARFAVDFGYFNFERCENMGELLENSVSYFLNEEEFTKQNKLLIERLERDDILDTIENPILEKKIKNIKNNELTRNNIQLFLKNTQCITRVNPTFHVDTFIGLIKNLEQKLHNNGSLQT